MLKGRLSLNLHRIRNPTKEHDEHDYDCPLNCSPPPSPYPGRRGSLPPRMEAELKVACAAVVVDTIPSHFNDEPLCQLPAPKDEQAAAGEPSDSPIHEQRLSATSTGDFSISVQLPPTKRPASPPMISPGVPDFPLPSRHSMFIHRAGLDALFDLAAKSNATIKSSLNKRRSHKLTISGSKEGQHAGSRPVSRSGPAHSPRDRPRPVSSIISNLPFLSPPTKPRIFRRATYDTRPDTAADEPTITPKNPSNRTSIFRRSVFGNRPNNATDERAATHKISLRPRPLSAVFSKKANRASYHGSTKTDFGIGLGSSAAEERERSSWYKFLFGGGHRGPFELREHAKMKRRSRFIQAHRDKTLLNLKRSDGTPANLGIEIEETEGAETAEIGETSELRSAHGPQARSAILAIKHNPAQESPTEETTAILGSHSQVQIGRISTDDDHSTRSRRSSASSGVIPIHYSRFSWKNIRRSWASWRDTSEDEDAIKRNTPDKRRSNGSYKVRKSIVMIRDTQQLPMINQDEANDPESDFDLEPSKALPFRLSTQTFGSPFFTTPVVGTIEEDHTSHEQSDPNHDGQPHTHDIIMPLTAHPVFSNGSTPKLEAYRLSVPSFEDTEQFGTIRPTEVTARPSTSPAPKSVSAKGKHIPRPLQMSPPPKRFSLIEIAIPEAMPAMKDHRKSIDLVEAVQLAKAAGLKKQIEFQEKMEAMKEAEAQRLSETARNRLESRKSTDFKKSIEFWKSLEKRHSNSNKRKSAKMSPYLASSVGDRKDDDNEASDSRPISAFIALDMTQPPEDIPLPMSETVSLSESISDESQPLEGVPENKISSQDMTPTDSVIDKEVAKDSPSRASSNTEASVAVRAESADTVEALPTSPTSAGFARPQRPLSWLPLQQDLSDIVKTRNLRAESDAQGLRSEESKSIAASSVRSMDRKGSVDFYNTLQSTRYMYADDINSLRTVIPPPGTLQPKRKKFAWRLGRTKKPSTWMDEMEALGIKDGILLVDQLDGPPIVRY